MTTTTTMKLRSIFAALCLAACNASLGDGTDTSDETGADPTGSSNTNSTAPTTGNPDIPGPCTNSNPCPDGQYCFNGFCALGCNSNGDCAEDQYCATDGDGLCHNKEVSTCPDVPCGEGQVCVNGFCSTPPPDTQCTPSLTDDGCESNAVCLYNADEEAKCYTLPYCAEDGTCPTGAEGAVCNDGLFADKEQICLIGLCTAAEHCPADWKCVKDQANAVIGYCSDGGPWAPCSSGEDCLSGACDMPFPGETGLCQ